MPSTPISQTDILFPLASTSISSTLTSLKRTNLSISNRLHSISQDTGFVLGVAASLQLPLVANERCGSWYIPPSHKNGSAYFKSTDGHFGEWGFSLRRLNLQVLEIIGSEGDGGGGRGCIVVDSTRRGKSMPDALSKTVGIWIAVMNRLLFPSMPRFHSLATPEDVVSASELAQIEARLDGFVREARSLELDVDALREKVKKPMRPAWVTPATDLADLRRPQAEDEFATIALCTASSRASSSDMLDDPKYVQGAADDSEAWALGLDASTFWMHSERLLSAREVELPELIAQALTESKGASSGRVPTLIKPTESIWIGERAGISLESSRPDVLICCGGELSVGIQTAIKQAGGLLIHLACTSGKTGSRQLRAQLPQLHELRKLKKSDPRILVACQTGKDLSVGVALAVICMFCSPEGKLDLHTRQPSPNKAEIKKRLSWIMASMPDASPSRATLQSVNAFLMG